MDIKRREIYICRTLKNRIEQRIKSLYPKLDKQEKEEEEEKEKKKRKRKRKRKEKKGIGEQ